MLERAIDFKWLMARFDAAIRQFLGRGNQLVGRQAAMAVVHRLGQRMGNCLCW